MNILLNGKNEPIKEAYTVKQLLEQFLLEPAFTIVELNSAIISKEKFAEQILKDGDTVELIRFMGGGA